MKEAVIVSAARTAVGKANKGTLANYRPEDMGAAAVAEAVKRAEGLDPADIDDVMIGCAMPEGEQGLNMGRVQQWIAQPVSHAPSTHGGDCLVQNSQQCSLTAAAADIARQF